MISRLGANVRELIDVGLTALAERRYETAEQIFRELDQLDPDWIYWQTEVGSCRTQPQWARSAEAKARQTIIALVSLTHTNRAIAAWLGLSPQRIAALVKRGWSQLYERGWRAALQGHVDPGFAPHGGPLEDDFAPAEERREERRRVHLAATR